MSMILLLGFSSGLPLFLTSTTLQAWMTKEGVSLASIGLFSLVALPYSLKFLWSPLLDRYVPPFMGRRRGWLVITQIALILTISLMFFQQPKQALQLLAVNAIAIAFFSASQDIAFDAYRTDVLDEPEMGAGAAITVLGYRLALVITGSLALVLADQLSWPVVYLFMAGLMLVGLVSTFFAPEPTKPIHAPENLLDAVVLPFRDFFQSHRDFLGVVILLFITLYKFGDAVLNNMSTPFLLKTGFSQTDLGVIRGGMGIVATLVGTLVGGSLMTKLGIYKSLWVFGVLQCLSNVGYLAIALSGKNYDLLVLSINIENFCGGMGTAAYVAYLMSLCNPSFTATQYALLSSLMAVSRDILIAPAGKVAEMTGWTNFMILSIVAAIPGLLLLPVVAPWGKQKIGSGQDL
jgi:MFS transporter, PAT family, beta-lactamase induction signal transducer AmpG